MKKWWVWLILALVYIFSGIVNYVDNKSINGQIIQVIIAVILAVCQFFCDSCGEKGKKIFKYICIFLMFVFIVSIILSLFK